MAVTLTIPAAQKAFNLGERSPGCPAWIKASFVQSYIHVVVTGSYIITAGSYGVYYGTFTYWSAEKVDIEFVSFPASIETVETPYVSYSYLQDRDFPQFDVTGHGASMSADDIKLGYGLFYQQYHGRDGSAQFLPNAFIHAMYWDPYPNKSAYKFPHKLTVNIITGVAGAYVINKSVDIEEFCVPSSASLRTDSSGARYVDIAVRHPEDLSYSSPVFTTESIDISDIDFSITSIT